MFFPRLLASSALSSDVQTDNLGGWHLQLLVDACLQVLIQQRLELLVLLVEQTGLLDKVLSLGEHLVIAAQRLVERLPHTELLGRQNRGQLLPEHLLLLLVAFCLLLLALEVGLLLGGHANQLLLDRVVLLVFVELLKSHHQVVGVQGQARRVALSLRSFRVDLLLTLPALVLNRRQRQA